MAIILPAPDHKCCKHDDPSVREGVCCVCDADSPCQEQRDRDLEPVNA